MKYNNFEVVIASLPDRNKLVAEISYNGEFLAEINQENSELLIELFPRQNGKSFTLDYNDFSTVMKKAEKLLLED